MDPKIIAFRAEFLALETLVVGLMRGLIATIPDAAGVLQQKGTQFAEELRLRAIRGVTPEESDALSAEIQDAWERLIQRVLDPKE